jgi:predicted nucleotidyltransferase
MRLIDLNPVDLETVKSILRQYIPQQEVWAFGSRVRWTARERSDLDLAVHPSEPLAPGLLADLKEAFELSDLPMKVDIVDWSRITPAFQEIIRADYIPIQSSREVDDWRTVRLGDICEIHDGPHATPPKTAEGPIFLRVSNLVEGRLDLREVEHVSLEDFEKCTRGVTPRAGDLVFPYETRLGEAALIPEGLVCCLGRRMGLLRAHPDRVDPRFLLYAFLGPDFQQTIRSRTIRGSTVDRISLGEMGGLPIRLPSLLQQQAIARILGALDDRIEINRRASDILGALRDTLLPKLISGELPVPDAEELIAG